MKKVALLIVALIIFSLPAYGKDDNVINLGILGYLGTTEKAFQEGFDNLRNVVKPDMLPDDQDAYPFIRSLLEQRHVVHFYNSLMNMMMGLRSGRVDRVMLPMSTANYVLSINSNYEAEKNVLMLPSSLSFAFLEDNVDLKNEFDKVLTAMKEDGTLRALEQKYVKQMGQRVESIKPEFFSGADTITVAVTGDMPPLDMFAGDGNPAGYSTAILAEIGKRLQKNIKFLNVSAGGRSSALYSGRADVVFWCRVTEKMPDMLEEVKKLFTDKPAGVILSVPYYSWDKEVLIKNKEKGGFFNMFRR